MRLLLFLYLLPLTTVYGQSQKVWETLIRKIENLETKNQAVIEKNSANDETIKNLEQKNSAYDQTITNLEQKNSQYDQTIKSYEQTITNLEQKNSEYDQATKILEQKNSLYENNPNLGIQN